MPLNNFIRSGMDTELANTGGNAQSSFRGSDERKALKAAKAARLSFRKSKGYGVDNYWSRLFKSLF